MQQVIKAICRWSLAFVLCWFAMGSAPAEAQPFTYVTNIISHDVSVINTATNTEVLPRIPVGSEPFAVAITPNGAFVYVANKNSDDVSVINTATNTEVLPRIPVGSVPFGVAITPNGAFAYVTNENSNDVSVINTATNTEVLPRIPVGSSPWGVAITPNGAFVYVVNRVSSDVSVINTATNTEVLPRIPVGIDPFGVAIAPNGAFVYVANSSSNDVSVINTATNTEVLPRIPVGPSPYAVAIAPNGAYAYVANVGSHDVSVINTSTNTEVLPRIPVGSAPVAVAITPNGAFAYVTNNGSNNVSVIDTSTNTEVLPRISVGSSPWGVAITNFAGPAPLPGGLVSWWDGDLVSGATVFDLGSGINGKLVNGATTAPGKVGNAFSFDGVDDSVVVPDSPNLNVTTQFTLNAWINPSSLQQDPAQGGIVSKIGGGAGNHGYQFGLTGLNGILYCQFNAPGEQWPTNSLAVTLPNPLPIAQWSHVACTYDNEDLKIFVNGALASSMFVGPKTVASSAANFRISGDDNFNGFFHGLIDEVQLFNRALSNAEIQSIYLADSAGVNKGTTRIFWNNPADIFYGTALTATQLNATANVPGTFTYTPAAGTVLNAGNGQTLHVDFVPDDAVNYTNASKDVFINVIQATAAPTTTALISSLNPSTFGQPVSFTATVSSSSGVPIGLVTFKDGATSLGTATLNASGQASLNTAGLSVGTHTITAVYGGSLNFATSTSGILTQTVNRAPTATTLASSSNPSALGQAVTFTATVSGAGGLPTGTVTFLDGNTSVGTGTLNASGQAVLMTSSLTIGTHNMKATYGGDATYAGSSGTKRQEVQAISTTTTLSSSLNPSAVNQVVTFTAQVTSSGGIPTGTVTFKDSGKTLATATLNASGQASFSTPSLKKGSHKMTAEYGGNANFGTSTSPTVTQVVQ